MEENKKIGKWTLLRPEGGRWVCRCDCGVVKSVLTANLRERRSNSCGCQRTRAHHLVMVTGRSPHREMGVQA